jgi:hypothetical protein
MSLRSCISKPNASTIQSMAAFEVTTEVLNLPEVVESEENRVHDPIGIIGIATTETNKKKE